MWRYWLRKGKKRGVRANPSRIRLLINCSTKSQENSVSSHSYENGSLSHKRHWAPSYQRKNLQIIKAANLKQISIQVSLLNANLQGLYARVYISQKNSITGINERGSLICGQSSFHSTSTVTNVLIQLRLPPSGSPFAVKREIRSSSQIPYLELTHFNT